MEDKTRVLLLLSKRCCSLLGPSRAQGSQPGTLPPRSAAPMAEGRGAWPPWEAIPQSRVQEMGEGRGSWELDLSWRPGARKWGFVLALPLNYLVGLPPLGLSLPTCKRSLMYLMIPKGDSPMTSLFLSRPEPSRMAELPSRVFQFIHSAIISKYFLRMEMEGEEGGRGKIDGLSVIADLTLLVVSIWERPPGLSPTLLPHFTEEETEAQEGVVTSMGRFSVAEPKHPYLYNGKSGPCISRWGGGR